MIECGCSECKVYVEYAWQAVGRMHGGEMSVTEIVPFFA